MQSIGTGLSNLLARYDPEKAKGLHNAQNNACFENAIRRTWSDNPDAAEYLLAHTNSIYFKKDEAPRTGPDKDDQRIILGIYLDDSLARSEINARRETLIFRALHEGLRFDEVLIHPATRGMKGRHLFPASVKHIRQELGDTSNDATTEILPVAPKTSMGLSPENRDQTQLLQIFKRAVCQAIKEPDLAESLLARIAGANLERITFNRQVAHSLAWYRCSLCVRDIEATKNIIQAFEPSIISCAKPLGLILQGIRVYEATEHLRNREAFPRLEQPQALDNADVRRLRQYKSHPSAHHDSQGNTD